jgi:hypothetical protein
MSPFLAPIPDSLTSRAATGLLKGQAAAAIFAVMAAVYLAWPIWRLGFPVEINRNEPWNAWFIDAVLNGTPLYPSRNQLIVNNYPPLSFYVTALAAKLTGDTIVAGRLLSLLSAGAVSLAAALCIRALGGSRTAAAFGGLWLLATIARFFARYAGVNDPSLLGLALMGLAFAISLLRQRAGQSAWPAIALMVLAGFVKQNLPALPLAALFWLAITNRRAAFGAAIWGVALCAGGFLLCTLLYGPDFLAQMTIPREISLKHMLSTLNKLQWIAPALLFFGLWAWPERRAPAVRFCALLLGLSLVSGLVQAAGAGVTYNAYLEAVFASAIAVALAFEGLANTPAARRFGLGAMRSAMIAVLVLRLLLSQQLEPYLVLFSPSFRDEVRQIAAAMSAESSRVASIPGPVSCSVMTACYRGGKSFVYDPFWTEQGIAKQRLTVEGVDGAVKDRAIRFEAIDPHAILDKKRL